MYALAFSPFVFVIFFSVSRYNLVLVLRGDMFPVGMRYSMRLGTFTIEWFVLLQELIICQWGRLVETDHVAMVMIYWLFP